MIPKITPKIESKIPNVNKKLPKREVVITSKNGKDRIDNIFIGDYPRVSIIDTIRDLFYSFVGVNSRH